MKRNLRGWRRCSLRRLLFLRSKVVLLPRHGVETNRQKTRLSRFLIQPRREASRILKMKIKKKIVLVVFKNSKIRIFTFAWRRIDSKSSRALRIWQSCQFCDDFDLIRLNFNRVFDTWNSDESFFLNCWALR